MKIYSDVYLKCNTNCVAKWLMQAVEAEKNVQ